VWGGKYDLPVGDCSSKKKVIVTEGIGGGSQVKEGDSGRNHCERREGLLFVKKVLGAITPFACDGKEKGNRPRASCAGKREEVQLLHELSGKG